MAVSFPSDAETFVQTVIPTAIPVSRVSFPSDADFVQTVIPTAIPVSRVSFPSDAETFVQNRSAVVSCVCKRKQLGEIERGIVNELRQW